MVDERQLYERVFGRKVEPADPIAAIIILIEELRRVPPVVPPVVVRPPPPVVVAPPEIPKVEVVPPPRAPNVKYFPKPHQTLTVPAGKQKRVYYFRIPDGYTGFVQYVGNNWFDDTVLYWYIDDVLVIDPHINYQIASVNMPKPLVPWVIVKKEIIWEVKNSSGLDCLFEVRCDGIYLPTEDVHILLKMGLPISER